VELDYSKHLIKKLLQGDLDLVIGRILDHDGADELAFEPLADERHAVIARAKHPLASKRMLSLADIVGQGWILPEPGSVARDRLVEVFAQQSLALPSNVVQTTSLPVITNLLRMTDMVAAIPVAAVQPYCQAGLLTVLIDDLGISIGPFGIVTRRNRSISPGAQALLTAIREVAASLYARHGAKPALRKGA
jgi:DNA-binding transcriptional LysR family regulator